MKMKIKKTLLLTFIIFFILLISTSFLFLPLGEGWAPVTKAIAKHKMQQYLNVVYDYTGDFSIYYNSKSSCWIANAYSEPKDDIPSSISCSYFTKYISDGNTDKYYLNEFNNDLQYINKLLSSEDKINYSSFWTMIPANGKYTKDYKNINKSQGMDIAIRLWGEESKKTNKSELICKIKDCLSDKYTINKFRIVFIDDEFSYVFEGKNLNTISVKKLESILETKQRDPEDIRIEKEELLR